MNEKEDQKEIEYLKLKMSELKNKVADFTFEHGMTLDERVGSIPDIGEWTDLLNDVWEMGKFHDQYEFVAKDLCDKDFGIVAEIQQIQNDHLQEALNHMYDHCLSQYYKIGDVLELFQQDVKEFRMSDEQASAVENELDFLYEKIISNEQWVESGDRIFKARELQKIKERLEEIKQYNYNLKKAGFK